MIKDQKQSAKPAASAVDSTAQNLRALVLAHFSPADASDGFKTPPLAFSVADASSYSVVTVTLLREALAALLSPDHEVVSVFRGDSHGPAEVPPAGTTTVYLLFDLVGTGIDWRDAAGTPVHIENLTQSQSNALASDQTIPTAL